MCVEWVRWKKCTTHLELEEKLQHLEGQIVDLAVGRLRGKKRNGEETKRPQKGHSSIINMPRCRGKPRFWS